MPRTDRQLRPTPCPSWCDFGPDGCARTGLRIGSGTGAYFRIHRRTIGVHDLPDHPSPVVVQVVQWERGRTAEADSPELGRVTVEFSCRSSVEHLTPQAARTVAENLVSDAARAVAASLRGAADLVDGLDEQGATVAARAEPLSEAVNPAP